MKPLDFGSITSGSRMTPSATINLIAFSVDLLPDACPLLDGNCVIDNGIIYIDSIPYYDASRNNLK